MPDDIAKTESSSLPSQQPNEQAAADNANEPAEAGSVQAKFNPSGQIEDIFENTEKAEEAGGLAGFKVKPATAEPVASQAKPSPPPVPAASQPVAAPRLNAQKATISKPLPSQLTQDAEFDDDPESSKKRYFVIGLVGIVVIVGVLGYWFFFRNTDVAPVTDQIENEQTEPVASDNPINQPVPQTPPVTESGDNDIISNPIPDSGTEVMGDNDSDQDGLSNEEETSLGTNPLKADTDNDGLFDREEVKVYLTNPINPDTDNDGFLDGEEVVNGFNPKGDGSFLPAIQ